MTLSMGSVVASQSVSALFASQAVPYNAGEEEDKADDLDGYTPQSPSFSPTSHDGTPLGSRSIDDLLASPFLSVTGSHDNEDTKTLGKPTVNASLGEHDHTDRETSRDRTLVTSSTLQGMDKQLADARREIEELTKGCVRFKKYDLRWQKVQANWQKFEPRMQEVEKRAAALQLKMAERDEELVKLKLEVEANVTEMEAKGRGMEARDRKISGLVGDIRTLEDK